MSKITIKESILNKLRVLGILLGVFLIIVAARFIVAHTRTIKTFSDKQIYKHPKVTNEKLTKIEGTGLQKLMENKNLAFSVDFSDGNIEVLDKSDNYVWRSKPTEAEMANDQSNEMWKANIQSPILITCVSKLTQPLPSYVNAYSDKPKVSVYKLDGGIRVYLEYPQNHIAIAMDYYLYDDHLEVNIPDYMIKDVPISYTIDSTGVRSPDPSKTPYMIYEYSVLPYFGAIQSTSDKAGFMFVPDATGGIINISKTRTYNTEYNAIVYGSDYSYYSAINNSMARAQADTVAYYPVFGMNHGDHSLLAVIDSGESTATIKATPAGVTSSFNSICAVFRQRSRYVKLTSFTGTGLSQITDFPANITRDIDYYFLHGDDSNYVGMAKAYRNYLINEKGIKKMDPPSGKIPLELTLFGGDEESGLVSGFVPMTTFSQAQSIVEYFRQNGVSNMDIIYDAWFKRGNSVKMPERFPPASQLGGAAGLKKFTDFAHSLGFKVYMVDWNKEISSSKGITKRTDTVYDIQDTPLNFGTLADPYYLLNTNGMKRIMDNSIKEYKKLGVDGIQEWDATILTTDFNSQLMMNREQVKNETAKLYWDAADALGNIQIWGGMAYTLKSGTTIVNPASRYSYSPLIDENVPFYPIALHGLVNMVSEPYNTMSEPQVSVLKSIEYGMNVGYELTAEPTEKLRYSNFSGYLNSTYFNDFKDQVLGMYKKLNDAFGDCSTLFITNHQRIADNVYMTTYENGKSIICNYSDSDYNYNGITVPSMDFIAVKGK